MHLSLKFPPVTEPVSLEEAKTYLRLSSDHEDALVQTLIASARAYVEKATGRALLKQGWVLALTPPYPPAFPLTQTRQGDIRLRLPFPPLLEVISFQSRGKEIPFIREDETLKISAHLYGEPLLISYWAGYGERPDAIPPDLKMSILMGVRSLYEGQKMSLPLLSPYKVLRVK